MKEVTFARQVFNELCWTKYGISLYRKLVESGNLSKISHVLAVSNVTAGERHLSTIRLIAKELDVPAQFVASIFKYEGAEK